jgi:hypothetical protein
MADPAPRTRLGHRWIDRGPTRVCINCSTQLEEAMSPKTGKMIKVYKKATFWSPERPECVWQ